MSSEVLFVLRLAVGLVFLWACIAKLRRPQALIAGLSSYGLIPEMLLRPSAILLILAEGFVAVSHLSGQMLYIGLCTALALLFGSIGAVLRILKSGKPVRCVCFGADGDEMISAKTLLRLLMLLAMEISILAAQQVAAHSQQGTRATVDALWLLMLCAVLLIVLLSWLSAIPGLLELLRRRAARSH